MQLYIYCTCVYLYKYDNKYCCKMICSIYAVPYEVKKSFDGGNVLPITC